MLSGSFSNGLRLGGDASSRDILPTGAESLRTRFNPQVGAIQSWDKRPGWDFPVILDNRRTSSSLLGASRSGLGWHPRAQSIIDRPPTASLALPSAAFSEGRPSLAFLSVFLPP